jgi:hypothetical protein
MGRSNETCALGRSLGLKLQEVYALLASMKRMAVMGLSLLVICEVFNYAAETPPSDRQATEIAALKAEIERLKGIVPDQSHAMKDVAYHFANLWFAGEKKNWPLADFYWSETRSHLRWAVRIIPVRKDPQGHDVRLSEILEPIEKTSLEELHKTIDQKDIEKFESAYKQMLQSCYACHMAAGKPFLRLQIPQQPEAPIIDFQPER